MIMSHTHTHTHTHTLIQVCHLCRVKFSLVTRQQYCGACGKVFCEKCYSKHTIIPRMGIERMRVCDTCYDAIIPNAEMDAGAPTLSSGV